MLGAQIHKLRMEHGWTQATLAKKVNVNIKSIKNWETDVSDPSVRNIIQLATVFSVTSDSLLGIQSHEVIVLDGFSVAEQQKIKTLIQAGIQLLKK